MKTNAKVRTRKPRYEPLVKLPPLPPDQYEALRQNIAVNGVLVPILVDSDGPKRRIIDGNHRKQIANELGYDCPEIVHNGDEEELRTLARALNLARRQLTTDQKRHIVADQLRETSNRSSRWVGKMLGVDHKTVASVRMEMAATGEIPQLEMVVGEDGKSRPASRTSSAPRPAAEQRSRIGATTMIRGDCRRKMLDIATGSVDAIIADPPYPCVDRDYGRMTEAAWHDMMKAVVVECRRVLKPKGSAVIILQPNFEKLGQMRAWLWEFMAWACREWNVVQDAYWWCPNTPPTRASQRKVGLLRQSVKMCVWLGSPDCYRNQDAVLWEVSDSTASLRWEDRCLRHRPSGQHVRNGRAAEAAFERGGSTPFNLLPVAAAHPNEHRGHPASTPYDLAAWWVRYILPPGGVLLDPFCGSGTMLAAALDNGASKVLGIDKEAKYLKMAAKRVKEG